MNQEQYNQNLNVPTHPIDVVIDTDTYNEVDDQFAVAYLLANDTDCLHVQALYAAPFFNEKSTSPADGMERSYQELCTILKLAGREDLLSVTLRGSTQYLPDEKTPVLSDAAADLVKRAESHSPENPLYVVAIGTITNVASALLMKPEIKDNMVVVWLGGHAYHVADKNLYPEFNMYQDIAAARVVFASGAPLVQLPCNGVVSAFSISYAELSRYLKGKNKLCDFLIDTVSDALGEHAETEPRSRIIWDVTAVAWLLNTDDRFMKSELVSCPIPLYDNTYAFTHDERKIRYVYLISRDNLATDLFKKLADSF